MESIGPLTIEMEAYEKVKLYSWIFFPILTVMSLIQAFCFYLYNHHLHPFSKILSGIDTYSEFYFERKQYDNVGSTPSRVPSGAPSRTPSRAMSRAHSNYSSSKSSLNVQLSNII